MRALVTGGGGFIGSHLVTHLVEQGHEVRVLDNFATGRRSNLAHVAGEFELMEGDIQSYERASKGVAGCEVVFHQAALPSVPRSVQDPLTSNATNVVGTLNVLLAARDHGVRRVILASSSSVYGPGIGTGAKREDQATEPISPYATAKLAGEGYARSFYRVYGLETVCLRYFNVFGPRQDPASEYSAVIPRFITALLRGEAPVIYGDGEQSRDFSYVSNVIRGNLLAANATEAPGKTYNIACGERISLNDLAMELRDLLGADFDPVYAAPRAGDIKHSLADIAQAQQELGYSPEVRLREGLHRTIKHLRKEEPAGQSRLLRA